MATRELVSDRLERRRATLQEFTQIDPVQQTLPLVNYYHIAQQLYRQSEVYCRSGQFDRAYVFIARFIKLCSKVIPNHRDYSRPKYAKERDWVTSQAPHGLALFERILDGMEEEERDYLDYIRDLERQASEEEEHELEAEESLAPPAKEPDELEQRLAALKLGPSAAKLGPSSAASAKRPLSSTYPGSVKAQSTKSPVADQRMVHSSVAYPSIGKASWMTEDRFDGAGMKERHQLVPLRRQRSKEAMTNLSSGRIRSLKIPTAIVKIFNAIADPNTKRMPDGVETCGILGGVLDDTRLVITTLIIPKQEGSSIMCTMLNEEELFDYCFAHDLLTLGWIHTHPRQNCFLSSVDLHTQCGFQSILPEAVAIVVAPCDVQQNVGVFRLSEPGGLQLIQNCTLSGFHPHPENIEIYSSALECEWDQQTTPMLVDMRGTQPVVR